MLFATLDPTMRAVEIAPGRRVILSDTVGFISDLPTQLVAAFRATLEEVMDADLILHVRDIAHPDSAVQAEDVATILGELGLGDRGRGADDRGLEQDRHAAGRGRRGAARDRRAHAAGGGDLGADGAGARRAARR